MSTTEMSARAAEEILAMLGRRRMNKSELARQLKVSHTWVTNRLSGSQEIGLNELQRIAVVLGVDATDLLPRKDAGTRTVGYLPGERVVATAGETRRRKSADVHGSEIRRTARRKRLNTHSMQRPVTPVAV